MRNCTFGLGVRNKVIKFPGVSRARCVECHEIFSPALEQHRLCRRCWSYRRLRQAIGDFLGT